VNWLKRLWAKLAGPKDDWKIDDGPADPPPRPTPGLGPPLPPDDRKI
jgi:hypothetical protein